MGLSVDASNACIPPHPASKLTAQTPPLPKTERGIPLLVDGTGGRINSNRPLIVYPSGRLVVIRELSTSTSPSTSSDSNNNNNNKIKSFVYRGHTAQVTVAKFSPSGCYVASADTRGKLRVWSYDNEEHLCKLDLSSALSGPIRDLSWDFESKRLVVVGEGSPTDPSSVCAKVIQWDTGVKVGDLGQHARNKASTCAFKPNRPMRIVTGGSDDFKCILNKGPPFARVPPVDNVPAEVVHARGSVHCVRYNKDGSLIASVGTDKSVAIYDGKTMELIKKMDQVHDGSIYSCSWSDDGVHLLTCSADGTVKMVNVVTYDVVQTWNVASYLSSDSSSSSSSKRVPMGGMMMGCTFVHGNVPIAVAMNGRICILPKSGSNSGSEQEEIQNYTGHQGPISGMAVDHTSDTMYTCDSLGVVVKWQASTITAIENVQRNSGTEEGFDDTVMNKIHSGAITGVATADSLVYSIGWDDNLRISSGNRMVKKLKLEAQPNAISTGSELTAILTVKGLQLVKNGELFSNLIALPYEASSICISSDDSTIYVGGLDNNIHVYQVNGDAIDESHTLRETHSQPVYALALSNDGTKLASADTRDICVWNVEDEYAPIIGRSRWCFHQQRINTLAWSNDDSILASGANDDSIYFWSLKKKTTRVHYPHCHRGGVTALKFLKNQSGMVLVSVGNDACVNQWDVTDDVLKKFR